MNKSEKQLIKAMIISNAITLLLGLITGLLT